MRCCFDNYVCVCILGISLRLELYVSGLPPLHLQSHYIQNRDYVTARKFQKDSTGMQVLCIIVLEATITIM